MTMPPSRAASVLLCCLVSSKYYLQQGGSSSSHNHGSLVFVDAAASRRSQNLSFSRLPLIPRGGSTSTRSPSSDDDAADDEYERIQKEKERQEKQAQLQKYKLEQQHLLQLRSTFLSEALAARGISVGPTMTDVQTPEGSKPPQETDWDCCLSTHDDPKSCLYSFDAEPNTKVISPIGTTQYISLSALNRLRRTDPSKVEPMWHSQYSILKSWFSDESPYSILQYVGFKGFVISTLLLDLANGLILKSLLAFSILSVLMILMPLLDFMIGRVLVSSTMWMKWQSWGRFVHAALPLKILIGQMAYKFVAGSFGRAYGVVRDYVVEMECMILEECMPVTIGDAMSDDDDNYSEGEEEDSEADEEDSDRY
jgi:hypothetical protein